MKKLFMILVMALCLTNANAATPTYSQGYANGYRNGYASGHYDGKAHAYNNVTRTVVFVAGAVIIGAVIYELGANSRWNYGKDGVVYRF